MIGKSCGPWSNLLTHLLILLWMPLRFPRDLRLEEDTRGQAVLVIVLIIIIVVLIIVTFFMLGYILGS